MCSIMGSFAANLTAEEFKEGFDRSVSRGPDETRVISPDDGVMMGFHRLAIMGLTEEGMQPFSLNGNFLVLLSTTKTRKNFSPPATPSEYALSFTDTATEE